MVDLLKGCWPRLMADVGDELLTNELNLVPQLKISVLSWHRRQPPVVNDNLPINPYVRYG